MPLSDNAAAAAAVSIKRDEEKPNCNYGTCLVFVVAAAVFPLFSTYGWMHPWY